MNNKSQLKKPSILGPLIGLLILLILFFYLKEEKMLGDYRYHLAFFLLVDLSYMARYFKKVKIYEKMKKEADTLSLNSTAESLNSYATITLKRKSRIVGALVPDKVFLNGNYVGDIKNGKTLDIKTTVPDNRIMIIDNDGNQSKEVFVATLKEGEHINVLLNSGKFTQE